jgi:hypothetical protein
LEEREGRKLEPPVNGFFFVGGKKDADADADEEVVGRRENRS